MAKYRREDDGQLRITEADMPVMPSDPIVPVSGAKPTASPRRAPMPWRHAILAAALALSAAMLIHLGYGHGVEAGCAALADIAMLFICLVAVAIDKPHALAETATLTMVWLFGAYMAACVSAYGVADTLFLVGVCELLIIIALAYSTGWDFAMAFLIGAAGIVGTLALLTCELWVIGASATPMLAQMASLLAHAHMP